MVTADAETTEVQPLESQEAPAEPLNATAVVSTPLAGDAGGTTVDAAPAEPSAPQSYETFEDYLKEQEGKESGEPAPETPETRETIQQPLVDPQAYSQARNTYANAVQRVQTTVNDLEKELVSDYGLPEATAKRIAKDMHDRVNELHAHGLNFYGLEAATQAEQRAAHQFSTHLRQGLAKGLPKPIQEDFGKWYADAVKTAENGVITHDVWIGKVVELARKGYITTEQALVQRKDSFNAGRHGREQAGEAAGADSGSNVRGAAGNGGSNTLAGYESRIAKGENLSDSQWAAYERLRAQAGL